MDDTARDSNLNRKQYMEFLKEISYTLAVSNDTQKMLFQINEIFQKYFCANNFQIFVMDDSTSAMHDFVKNWIVIEKNKQQEYVKNIFNGLKTELDESFVINNKLCSKSLQKSAEFFSKNIAETNNLLYFPVFDGNRLIGIIELNFDKNSNKAVDTEFLTILEIAITQIKIVILNKISDRKLETSIKFEQTIKSIAKLIETQFDLDYILPIIGELIDRFVSNHLIYIFLKDDKEKYKLFWPLDCQDENVLKLLTKIKDSESFLISKNGKAGVFAIRNEEKTIGLVAASSNIDKLSNTDTNYLCQLAAQTSVTTQRANSYAQVLKYATLDALTGLNNRRQFETRLKQETANAKRNKKPLCCIMLDIDYFKKVNDTWGHAAGDCVLKNVAKVVIQELREYDIASRYGGEEFCILLPDTKIHEAAFVAKRLRAAVEKADINISDDVVLDSDTLKVTISVGVSEFTEDMENPEILHQNADMALYEAKKRGRNRVIVFNTLF